MQITWRLFCLATLFLAVPLSASAQAQGAYETTSLLGRKLYAQNDDGSIASARDKLAGASSSVADYLAPTKAEAGRRQYQESVKTDNEALAKFPENADLLLERGHRELGLRAFAAAQKDLEHAVLIDPTSLDAHYHLGLAYYFQGQFTQAAVHLGDARDLSKTDDSLIDCSNWLYVSLRRAGKRKEADEVLKRITPVVHNTEPHLAFYLNLLHFYEGQVTEEQILPARPAPGDTEAELSYNTISYGLGNWHLYNGERSAATALFNNVVGGAAWNSWGFVASEAELARR